MMGITARMETFHLMAAIDNYTSSNIRIQFPGHKHHTKKMEAEVLLAFAITSVASLYLTNDITRFIPACEDCVLCSFDSVIVRCMEFMELR